MDLSKEIQAALEQRQAAKREEIALEFIKAYIISGRSYSEYSTLVDQGIKAADEFLAKLKSV